MLIALELRVMLHDLFRSVGLAISLIPNGLTKIATEKSAQRTDSKMFTTFRDRLHRSSTFPCPMRVA
jgi:hypothetical protein